jgi:hypothetical protein
MSPLLAKRPPGRVHKCFGRKVLRHFYVPFVDVTDARYGRMLIEKQTTANEWGGVLLSGRGDRTPLECFMPGIRAWEVGSRRSFRQVAR